MLTTPVLIEPELVQLHDKIEVAFEQEARALIGKVVRGQEGPKLDSHPRDNRSSGRSRRKRRTDRTSPSSESKRLRPAGSVRKQITSALLEPTGGAADPGEGSRSDPIGIETVAGNERWLRATRAQYRATVLDNRRLGWGLAALGMLLISTDSLFIRLAEATAWDMAFLVAVFSLPIFLALNRVFEQAGPRRSLQVSGRPLFLVAVLASISHVSFITAITRTAVSNVVVIVAAAPVVAAVMARLLLGERTSRQVWIAILATAVGIGIVVSGSVGQPTLDGDLLALLAIVTFATGLTVWRRYPQLSRYLGLSMSSIMVIVVTAPFTSLSELEPRTYAAAATMGLIFSPVGRIAHSSAPRFAPAAEVALFAPVETVAATLWAWLAFSEKPTLATMVGGLVIVGAVFYGTLGSVTAKRLAAPA